MPRHTRTPEQPRHKKGGEAAIKPHERLKKQGKYRGLPGRAPEKEIEQLLLEAELTVL